MKSKHLVVGLCSVFLLSCTITPKRPAEGDAVAKPNDRVTVITVERRGDQVTPVYPTIKGCDLFVMPQVGNRPMVPDVPAEMTPAFQSVLLNYVLELDAWLEARDVKVGEAYRTYATKCKKTLGAQRKG